MVEDASIEIDRVAVFKQKLTEMVCRVARPASLCVACVGRSHLLSMVQKLVDSKEEQAVRAAFEKFDTDQSGTVCWLVKRCVGGGPITVCVA